MAQGLASVFIGLLMLSWNEVFTALMTPSSSSAGDNVLPFDFSKYPECNDTGGISPSPAVPKLSEEFSLKMEVKMDALHYMDSEGYYEKLGQRGASFVMAGGVRSAYLFDFISGKAFSILGSDRRTCQAENLWETGCNTYAYFIAELAGHSQILGNCNLTAGNATYFGRLNTTIRAIKVDMWQQCVHDHRTNTTSLNKYYFTTNGVVPPSGSSPSPVRFETKNIDGPKSQQMSAYDFTYYSPEVKDDSVFLPERGVYCPGWTRENKIMPTLPDKFSLSMMTLAKKGQDVHNLQLNFDYKHGMVAFVTDSLNGTRFPPIRSKNRTLTRVINDYNSGLSFTMLMSTWLMGGKECYVRVIDNRTVESASNNSGEVHMKHAWELFGLSGTNWVYVGITSDYNGMPAYVWSSQRNNTKKDAATVMVTTEVYWLHENWTTTGAPVLIGLIVYRNYENGTVIETYQSTVSDFNTNSPSFNNWRAFDVEVCLKNGNEKVITFCLKVQNYTEIANLASFETGLRDAVADLSGTSPLQFTDIQLTKGDVENEAHVWMTVLDWVNKTGNVADPTKYKSVDNVIQNLKDQFGQKDYSTQINYANKSQPVTFLKNTIQTGSDLLRPTSIKPMTSTLHPVPPASIVQEGYTSGSMAGLAIAMIIIGGVAGLVAGFLLWKRNTGIAYQVYD